MQHRVVRATLASTEGDGDVPRAYADLLRAEQELVTGYVTRSHDAKEGLRAFLEHRAPRYSGS